MVRRSLRLVTSIALAALIVLAGCGSPGPPADDPDDGESPEPGEDEENLRTTTVFTENEAGGHPAGGQNGTSPAGSTAPE